MARRQTRPVPAVLPADLRPDVRRSLGPAVALRWVGNAGIRAPFTLLPAIASGTGLSASTVGAILAIRDLTGLTAVRAGRIADRRGPLPTVRTASWVLAAGLALTAAGPWGLLVGSVVFGLGKSTSDVAMNAWIGEAVRYENRARVSGLIETSWALAGLVAVPLLAQLVDRVAWWAAFLAMAGAVLMAVPLLGPGATTRPAAGERPAEPRPRLDRTALATHGTLALMSLSAQFLFITHGLWLDEAYDLEITEIGAAVAGLGLIELVASSMSSAGADRLGKRRSVTAGLVLLVGGMGILAALGTPSLAIALLLMAAALLGFEFGIVSLLPLVAEIDPAARATTIGIGFGGATLARALGSFVAVPLYEAVSMSAVMGVGAAVAAIATLLAITLVREPEPATAA